MKPFFFVLCVLLGTLHSSSQTAKAGWKDLSWAMTESQVKSKYPGVDPRVDVDGESFVLRFLFDSSHRLTRVNLVQMDPEAPEFTISKIENLLTEKYGKPALKQLKPKRLTIWNFKDVNIELKYSDNMAYKLIAVSYIKPDAVLKSNL